jgi:hypothetical protein
VVAEGCFILGMTSSRPEAIGWKANGTLVLVGTDQNVGALTPFSLHWREEMIKDRERAATSAAEREARKAFRVVETKQTMSDYAKSQKALHETGSD